MDIMKVLEGYRLMETNSDSMILIRGTLIDDEWVREWKISDMWPSLAELAQAAIDDHTAQTGR